MTLRKNTKKEGFLSRIPAVSLDSPSNSISSRCKFNLSYFDHGQSPSSNFSDLTKDQLCKLLEKLKSFSHESLQHWSNQRIGGGSNKVFSVYGDYPRKSDFTHPKHVPHQARWARFRLESDLRLIGFIVPDSYHDEYCTHTGDRFDKNTFYLVFIDLNHKFYLTKK